MKPLVILSMSALTLGACKFNDASAPDDAAPLVDAARPDSTVADGGPDGRVGPDGGPALPCDPFGFHTLTKVVVVGTDFGSPGTLATIDLSSQAVQKNRAVVGSDPVVRVFGECVFVISRFTDSNIAVYRASDLQLIKQWSTGAGTNPHDIALVSGQKAYVARFGDKKLLVADPFTGATRGEIDLSMFDQGDVPDMDSVVVAGNRAYVSLERLDSMFTPRGNGIVAVIDTTTDTLIDVDPAQPGVQGIALAKADPFGFMRVSGTSVWVSEVGDFSGTAGCLERLDATSNSSAGCYVSDGALGGLINAFSLDANSSQAWAAAAASFTQANIVAFSQTAPPSPRPFASTHAYDILDLVWAPSSFLYAVDADGSLPGVRIFTAAGGELTAPGAPLDIGKPPVADGIALAP